MGVFLLKNVIKIIINCMVWYALNKNGVQLSESLLFKRKKKLTISNLTNYLLIIMDDIIFIS